MTRLISIRMLLTFLAAFLLASFLSSGAFAGTRREVTRDRKVTPDKAEELYQELSEEHGWSRDDMGRALEISRRVEDLLEIYIDLFNQDIPPRAIERSFRTCEGYAPVVEDYWEMINRYHFPPQEVDTVFDELPGEIMRWYYFRYRAGGDLGAREKLVEEAKENEEEEREGMVVELPTGRAGNMYSKEECLGVFRRTRADMDVIEPYFEYRMEDGLSQREAWNRIEERTEERLAEERERREREEKEREEELRKRSEEAEEGRRRARELLGVDDEEDEKEDEEEEDRRRGYSIDELLGGNDEEEDEEVEEEDEDEAEDENGEEGDEKDEDEED